MHICIHFYRAKPDDQDNAEDVLRRLPPSVSWKFEKVRKEGDHLLLVLQSRDQQNLMRKYGNEICLLDATYRTTKYDLPLFFVVVKSNTVYQVVASFIVSEETSEQISAALNVLKEWNPSWSPANWMTDCCRSEMNALESKFPG